MKENKINWRVLIITSIICLLPILLGVSFYNRLPEEVAIHWDINNEPNGYASKEFFIFGLPIIMTLLQIFACVVNDLNVRVKGKAPKFEIVVKLIIPTISVIVYITTLMWALGNELDIRKVACFLVGAEIIVSGIYMPKVKYEENKKLQRSLFLKNAEIWDKVKRVFGYSYTIAGLLMIISIFLKPVHSLIALGIFGLVAIGVSVYAIVLSRKEK